MGCWSGDLRTREACSVLDLLHSNACLRSGYYRSVPLEPDDVNRHERWLAYASVIARDVKPVGHARICACLVYKGELLSVGWNSMRTHPFQKLYGRNAHSTYLHAEIDAIVKAQNRIKAGGISWKNCVLYVARVKLPHAGAERWVNGLAKPCDGCMRALHDLGITQIHWSEG